MEVLGPSERLTDQRTADDASIHHDQRTVRLVWKERLREPGHDSRVHDACDHAEQQGEDNGRTHLPGEHGHTSLITTRATSMNLIPANGTRIPPTP